ncbi:ABC transporter ATP-binding protein [Qingshengfaniella alkalisoli]|uniref:sn-glycerol-3-phosphate ABC transporter ATP-binding protein UgpC n=1 Tax=Qingshengfaniella alkalisoli TaxID=2599296 RepID=A0A5B8J3N3_9RHOB|nr:sn-glycerol-3-phosphate ABC transporter ATP-binding protein UgpC [Qingshengfaniella alkalisoli]QDY69097.1 sn-glycerol-3-phosphate ABC transporter ATP-binding protein UgpC [Qingshengfaniella alkalisoli]
MAGVTLNNVIKRYGQVQVIHGADLDIQDGEFVVFVGPSGCGKSTLLRMIAGLEDISDGEIGIGGTVVNDVEPADRGTAMVFQSYALYPHMTVEENLSFGLRMNGNDKADTNQRVKNAAQVLQIENLLERRPKQLSGGQRQRVAIGRAIVRNPEVFLFDEPLSNLDAELRVQMRVEIARLHSELGVTMIYVTHDQTEAMTLADRIVVLRDGRIEQIGSPLELYHDPVNQFVAGFMGSPKMNFMAAEIVDHTADTVTLSLANQHGARLALPVKQIPSTTHVTLGVRPEHFLPAGQGDCDLNLKVDVIEHLGATTFIYSGTKTDEQLIVERDESENDDIGGAVAAAIPAGRCHLFDEQGKRLT